MMSIIKSCFSCLGTIVQGLLGITVIIGTLIALLMGNRQEKADEKKRIAEIEAHRAEWGDSRCDLLIKNKIGLGMTEEMVRLALGDGYQVDQEQVSKSGVSKHRWVYGYKRMNAKYIRFEDGRVVDYRETGDL